VRPQHLHGRLGASQGCEAAFDRLVHST
jgi:hypothetical protein